MTSGLEQQLAGIGQTDPDELAATLGDRGGLTPDELLQSVDSVLLSPTKAGEQLRPSLTKRAGFWPELPVVSGALVGLVVALVLIWLTNALRLVLGGIPRRPDRPGSPRPKAAPPAGGSMSPNNPRLPSRR